MDKVFIIKYHNLKSINIRNIYIYHICIYITYVYIYHTHTLIAEMWKLETHQDWFLLKPFPLAHRSTFSLVLLCDLPVCLCLIAPSYKDYKWPHFSLIASFMALFRTVASDRQPVEQPRALSPDPLSLPGQNLSGVTRKDHSRLLGMVPCRSGFRALR